MFERALARASWPVKFTEGFNPRPRLSLPLPRTVGVAGEDERLVVELEQPLEPDEAMHRLRGQLPEGLRLIDVCEAPHGRTPQPLRAWYGLPLSGAPDTLDRSIEAFLGRDTYRVVRSPQEGGDAREVDIRPYVEALARAGDRLEMVLRITPQGTARPGEVLEAVGLHGPEFACRLRRVRVEWAEPLPP